MTNYMFLDSHLSALTKFHDFPRFFRCTVMFHGFPDFSGNLELSNTSCNDAMMQRYIYLFLTCTNFLDSKCNFGMSWHSCNHL